MLQHLFQVISLGDVIKFSVSPSKRKDSLTTNASGVPLDEKNLVSSISADGNGDITVRMGGYLSLEIFLFL